MMSSQTQNAISELMRMVGHMPQTNSSASSNTTQQPNRKPSQTTMRLPHYQSSNGNAFKPPKPLEKRTVALKPLKGPGQVTGVSNAQLNGLATGQLIDPRLLFPAAFQMPNNAVQKIPTIAPNSLQMHPQLFTPSMPTAMSFQMTPEMLAMMNMGSGWPTIDPTTMAIMQQPALLNKFYADYMAAIQQQQFVQSLFLQPAQNGIKLNESPKVTPPNSNPSTTAGNLDPLVSLHNMVHASAQIKQNSAVPEVSVIKKHESVEIKPDEEEEIIVDVETAEQPVRLNQLDRKATHNNPPLSAPPKISGPSFSIAEILHSNSQAHTIDGNLVIQMPTSTSVPPSLSQANQLSVDTLSSPIERTPDSQSPLIKKGLEPNKQRSAQRRKHVVEFHRRIKGITARTKFSQCQLCSEIVSTNNADLTNHVYSHSKVNLFACLRCEASFRQKGELHNHIKLVHPNETPDDLSNDLRDMGQLCDLLERCFPRNSKLVIDSLLSKLLKCCKGKNTLRCNLCQKDVPSNVLSLKKHLEQHPRYRCKVCHFTNENECEQISHGKENHSGECSPTYNVTSAAVVLSSILNACFGDYMPIDQKEFCEEIASIASSDSPQGSPQQSTK